MFIYLLHDICKGAKVVEITLKYIT